MIDFKDNPATTSRGRFQKSIFRLNFFFLFAQNIFTRTSHQILQGECKWIFFPLDFSQKKKKEKCEFVKDATSIFMHAIISSEIPPPEKAMVFGGGGGLCDDTLRVAGGGKWACPRAARIARGQREQTSRSLYADDFKTRVQSIIQSGAHE